MRRKEQQEMKKYGASTTLKQLLPALDSLDLAVKNSDANPESLKDGLRLLHAQFIDALSSAGVEKVSSNPGDKFNPAHHEAVMRVPSDSVPPNHIVESFCGAYTLHDRLLRAAMVQCCPRNRTETEPKFDDFFTIQLQYFNTLLPIISVRITPKRCIWT